MSKKYDEIREKTEHLARQCGLMNLTSEMVSNECGINPGSLRYFLGIRFSELIAQLEAEGIGTHIGSPGSRRTPSKSLRRSQILNAAVGLMSESSLHDVTGAMVAEAANVSRSLVLSYFGSIGELRDAALRQAIKEERLSIIAQAAVTHSPIVQDECSEELRDLAIKKTYFKA